MKIKDILKELEKLKNNEEKVQYLKEVLEEVNDKNLIEQINKLIKDLKENLEEKLDKEVPLTRKREVELNEIEQDIEDKERQIRPQQIVRRNIDLDDIKKDEVNYTGNFVYKQSTAPVYQTNQLTYESISQQLNTNIRLIEDVLVKESLITPGSTLDEVQKERIQDTIEKFMPHASPEEKLMAEQRIVYDIKTKDKDFKYATKLK